MNYVKETYGNIIDFQGKCIPEKERDMTIKADKDAFVRIACRLRKNKKEIASFDNYVVSLKDGSWKIDIKATPKYHKRMIRFLANPLPTLEKWHKADKKKAQKASQSLDNGTND